MGSNSSFYNQNQTVYTETNPPGPIDTGASSPSNPESPSSFYQDGAVYDAITSVNATLAEVNAAVAQTQTNATAAATSDSDAQTQATNAAASAQNAYTNATSAQSSATAAASSASTATSEANSATNSATSAYNSEQTAATQATNAAGSASAAATSATNAASSASAASTAASNAATDATNAANSASAAATSASNAADAVQAAAGTATPIIDGTAAVGVGTKWSREDHVHPTDTTRAPLASPAFTGTPTAPTPTTGDNSTKVATTAFVQASAVGVPALSEITASLSADVGLTTAGTYFDGPSVAQGSAGVWFVSGKITVVDTASSRNINVKLWDGTTVIDSTTVSLSASGLSLSASLSGVIHSPAGNIRISASAFSGTTSKIQFNQSGNSKDSTITAIRIG